MFKTIMLLKSYGSINKIRRWFTSCVDTVIHCKTVCKRNNTGVLPKIFMEVCTC